MATLTTTDLDNGKTDLETLSTVVNSQTESTTSTRLGDTVKTVKGLTDEFEQAIINSGYQVLGSFASGVTITAVNQVLDYDGGLYRTTEPLPYTTDGATPDLDSGEWVVVSDGVLSGIARSLNILDSEVIYSTDTVTILDDVIYIYDASAKVTWGKPSTVGAGETIVSVVGSALVTSGGSYTLEGVRDKLTFNTLEEARQSEVLTFGAALDVRERISGAGGGAAWDVVRSVDVVSNGIDIVESLGNPSLSIVLRTRGKCALSTFGVLSSNTSAENDIFFQRAVDRAETDGHRTVIGDVDGGVKITNVILPTKFNLYGNNGHQFRIDPVDAVSSKAIKLNGAFITFRDILFESSVLGVGRAISASSQFSYWSTYNVTFFGLDEAFNPGIEIGYWCYFSGTTIRECTSGYKSELGQKLNASTFVGLRTFKTTVSDDEYAIELTADDGVSFVGAQVQNQGFKFTNCKGVGISGGGYWEGFQKSILTCINSGISIPSKPFVSSGTKTNMDNDSYLLSSGFLPSTSEFDALKLSDVGYSNILPESKGFTQWTLDNFGSAGGSSFASKSVSGGVITLSGTATTNRATVDAGLSNNISAYAKVKITSGTARFRLSGTDSGTFNDLNSDADFQYVRLWGSSVTNGQKYFVIENVVIGTTTIEVHELLVSNANVAISAPFDIVNANSEVQKSNRFVTQDNDVPVFVAANSLTTLYEIPESMPNGVYMFSCTEIGFSAIRSNAVGVIYKSSTGLKWTPISESLCSVTVAGYMVEITTDAAQPDLNMKSGLVRIT